PEPSTPVSHRFALRRLASDDASFAEDVRTGLTAVQKCISPRYFYDDLGSALFEAICELPEYYVRRAETELLNIYKRDIAAALASAHRIVELGSGSGRKTRLLLSEIVSAGRSVEYIPVDLDIS